jgi:hypothetical protein
LLHRPEEKRKKTVEKEQERICRDKKIMHIEEAKGRKKC